MAAGAAWGLEVSQTREFRRPLNNFSTTIFSPEDGAPFLQRPPFLQLGRRRLWSAAVLLSRFAPPTNRHLERNPRSDGSLFARGGASRMTASWIHFMRTSHATSLRVRDLRSSR